MFRFSSALDTLLALQEAVEAARTSDFFGLSTTSRGAFPSINLFKDGDNTVLIAEVPGVNKDEIQINSKFRVPAPDCKWVIKTKKAVRMSGLY